MPLDALLLLALLELALDDVLVSLVLLHLRNTRCTFCLEWDYKDTEKVGKKQKLYHMFTVSEFPPTHLCSC